MGDFGDLRESFGDRDFGDRDFSGEIFGTALVVVETIFGTGA